MRLSKGENMKLDEFYNVKVENTKDLKTAKATWILDGKTYPTQIKSLAEKFSKANKEFVKEPCQKIEIESNLVFEIKKDGYNFFVAINGEKMTDSYNIEYIKINLDRLAEHFSIYSKLVENDVCYIVGKYMCDNKIAFKTLNDTNFITYIDFYLERWDNWDELEIIKMLKNYLECKDKNQIFEYIIAGEPGLAVFDNYIYIQNDKFYLTYQKAPLSPVEDMRDWDEQYNNEFNKVKESEVDARTLAKEIFKVFNENKEQILKHIPKENKEEFLNLLDKYAA